MSSKDDTFMILENALVMQKTLEWIVEQAADGYVILNYDHLVVYANMQAKLYLGIPTESPIPTPTTFKQLAQIHYQCVPQRAWDSWPAQEDEILPAAPPIRYLVHPESLTTNSLWLQVDLTKMAVGATSHYIVRLRDITSYVIAAKMIWILHTQIEHKLRIPLTVMTGYLKILKTELFKIRGQAQSPLAESLERHTKKLENQIIDTFTELDTTKTTRLGQGECELNRIPKIIEEVGNNLALKDIKTHIIDNNSNNTYMPLSRQSLELIFWELLQNARKLTENHRSSIEIEIINSSEIVHLHTNYHHQTLTEAQLDNVWTPQFNNTTLLDKQTTITQWNFSKTATLVWSLGGTCHIRNQENAAGLLVDLEIPLVRETKGRLW